MNLKPNELLSLVAYYSGELQKAAQSGPDRMREGFSGPSRNYMLEVAERIVSLIKELP